MALLSQHPKRLAFILLLVFGVAWVSYITLWQPEPTYQGRKLSGSLQELVDLGSERPSVESDGPTLQDWEDRHRKALAAVQGIGSKAVPHLLSSDQDHSPTSTLSWGAGDRWL